MKSNVKESYDLVAEDYATHYRDELDRKPFDRKMLDWLIEKTAGVGPICDMGCGPGQVARYLKDNGAQVCGLDLSTGMVEVASTLNRDINFKQADMTSLANLDDKSLGGIAAFYAIVHLQRDKLEQAFRQFHRVLKDNGSALVTFHIGTNELHRDEWWGKTVSLDFFFFETAEVTRQLINSGFRIEEVIERDPYPEIEYQSRRAYIFAVKD